LARFSDPEPLAVHHDVERFDCGIEALNVWLKKHALQAAAVGSARAFVILDDEQDRVVGYHALAAASITHPDATPRARKGMPRHPIPAALLARLAVDTSVQGRGIGAWLLRDAMLRALSASDELGIRVLLVHAIDDAARSFYLRHGFEPSRADALNLQILLKDVRASIEDRAISPEPPRQAP
jgi:GNAT superfamily N-acetyltransferase